MIPHVQSAQRKNPLDIPATHPTGKVGFLPAPPAQAQSTARRFWVALFVQTALIATVPAQAIHTHLTGKTVVLQTAPVDPYSLLTGYSQTLNYEISNPATLQNLPGWTTIASPETSGLLPGTPVYVTLAAPETTNTHPPQPWQPVAVNRDRPQTLRPNQVLLKGKAVNRRQIQYGLETYYIPEDQRSLVNADIRQARLEPQSSPIVVETKVGNGGRAIPVSFWVSDRRYAF